LVAENVRGRIEVLGHEHQALDGGVVGRLVICSAQDDLLRECSAHGESCKQGGEGNEFTHDSS
jgi:hypothetical protein